jgi:hypothetical protein
MSIPSNLYAEKVFAEQPVALWALDDDADFVSILSASDRNLSSWTLSGASKEQSTDLIKQIKKSPLVKISTNNSTGFTATSPVVVESLLLDQNRPSISVSTYFYSTTDEISNVKISLVNEDGEELSFTNYPLSVSNAWVFLSDTYALPFEDSKIKITVTAASAGDYDFYINGLSCGQWSEHFSTVSDGVDLIELPAGIAVDETHGYPAYAYGFSDQTGYYLGDNYSLYSYNDGFPLVYGASNVTRIVGRSGPSLILPGNGFLHDTGKYQDLTLEMWIKIFSRHLEPHRIVGPVGSEDGIYIDGPFLLLKVGPNVQSYFLNELERPMLLGFRISQYTASLVINGESVISMDIDMSSIDFPTQDSENWLGFYGYADRLSFELDAVAIYPYQVPEIVSKRRFAYGQAVDVPESINGSLVGSGVTFDYRVSDYANNYIYPDMGDFNQGILEGLSTEDGTLSTKQYPLPNIIFKNPAINLQDWLDVSYQDEGSSDFSSVDFSLAGSGNASGAYMLLDKISKVSQDVRMVYGIYKAAELTGETLFRIDSPSGAYLLVELEDAQIKYTLSYPNQPSIEMTSELPSLGEGEMFIAGIDLDKFSAKYGGLATNFVNEIKRCSLYIGGYRTFENMFTGKLYRFGLSTRKNSIPISSWSDEFGIIANVEGEAGLLDGGQSNSQYSSIAGGAEPASSLPTTRNGGYPVLAGALEELNYVATYTLAPRYYLGKFVLDIASYGYWQDQIPLSHFGKVVYDLDGNPRNTLNFLQLNVGVPKIDYMDSSMTYFDTSKMPVRTYVSFQYLSSGANKTDVALPSRQDIGFINVVYPGSNWMTTMYEVVSGTIIYPPSGIDYRKLAIVVHMIFETKSTMSNLVRVKRLELASQAMSEYRPTKIGTRFGTAVSPFVKRGLYPDYDGVNPIEIYKNSTPYFYLSKHSGLRVLGFPALYEETKGVSIAINPTRVSQYAVGAIQSFISYQESWVFPETPVKIMEVKAYNRAVEVFLQADPVSPNRGKLYAIDAKTKLSDQLVNFYLNGKLVKTPYISPMEWNVLTLQFVDSMKFNNFSGSIDFVGPILFNNVSTYRLSEIQTSITSIFRTWSQVEQFFDKAGNEPTNWGDFLSSNPQTTWENILFIPTIRRYLVDPVSIFQSYAGTNRISVSDSSVLSFKNYKYSLYKDLRWKSSIVTPV